MGYSQATHGFSNQLPEISYGLPCSLLATYYWVSAECGVIIGLTVVAALIWQIVLGHWVFCRADYKSKNMIFKAKQFGNDSETLAAELLQKKGFRILERNKQVRVTAR